MLLRAVDTAAASKGKSSGDALAGSVEMFVVWNAAGVASGVYFYKLESNGRVETKRMILMR